jgi:hypothetical protein
MEKPKIWNRWDGEVLEMAEKCILWHRWDVFRDLSRTENSYYTHIRLTKVCRKCGTKKIKEFFV